MGRGPARVARTPRRLRLWPRRAVLSGGDVPGVRQRQLHLKRRGERVSAAVPPHFTPRAGAGEDRVHGAVQAERFGGRGVRAESVYGCRAGVRVRRRAGAFSARGGARGGASGVRAGGNGRRVGGNMQGSADGDPPALRAHARLPHHRAADGHRRRQLARGVGGGEKDEHDVRVRRGRNEERAGLPEPLLRRGRARQGEQRGGARESRGGGGRVRVRRGGRGHRPLRDTTR
mmetsp:Transcript_12506/g.50245  ORF Transcript_12506/g.50245 Transcript_12506/m.50245 type:complete len:231 (+) Transcript_12506:1325-2017(+)